MLQPPFSPRDLSHRSQGAGLAAWPHTVFIKGGRHLFHWFLPPGSKGDNTVGSSPGPSDHRVLRATASRFSHNWEYNPSSAEHVPSQQRAGARSSNRTCSEGDRRCRRCRARTTLIGLPDRIPSWKGTHNIRSFNTAASGVVGVLPLCCAGLLPSPGQLFHVVTPLTEEQKTCPETLRKDHSCSLLLFALSSSTNTFTKTFQATPSPPPSQTFLPFPERGLGTREGRGRREPNKDGLRGPSLRGEGPLRLPGPNKKHRSNACSQLL